MIYNSKFYAALDNAVIVPGYARVDGAVYLKLSENISGQVNVENILGANYYPFAQNNNNIYAGRTALRLCDVERQILVQCVS